MAQRRIEPPGNVIWIALFVGFWVWVAVLMIQGTLAWLNGDPVSGVNDAPAGVIYSPPPGGVYYENPAPGDDGSYDCPPNGGPVYVGSSDPAGLDGDGDGWGCE